MLSSIKLETRIVDQLFLRASFIDDIGLHYGKLGIAIYLLMHATATGEDAVADLGNELLDEVGEAISGQTDLGFSRGLTGIGWGIELISKMEYAEIDTKSVLLDLDNQLYRRIVYTRSEDADFRRQIVAKGAYLLARYERSPSAMVEYSWIGMKECLILLVDEVGYFLNGLEGQEAENAGNAGAGEEILSQCGDLLLYLCRVYQHGLYNEITGRYIRQIGDSLQHGLKTTAVRARQYTRFEKQLGVCAGLLAGKEPAIVITTLQDFLAMQVQRTVVESNPAAGAAPGSNLGIYDGLAGKGMKELMGKQLSRKISGIDQLYLFSD